MRLSDTIEQFIKNMISEEPQAEVDLKRNELAAYFHCAPSQINYVLSTRFTPDHGYVTSSQRGGGGYIRIVRIVRGDHEIVRARGAELTAGRDLQPVVVPLGHDRQLQPQHGNLDIADIIIAVDRDGRHRRVYRRRRRRHARTRRRLPDSLRLDDRLDALEQALGLLPGLCVLLTVMDEEEQR